MTKNCKTKQTFAMQVNTASEAEEVALQKLSELIADRTIRQQGILDVQYCFEDDADVATVMLETLTGIIVVRVGVRRRVSLNPCELIKGIFCEEGWEYGKR